MLAARTRHPQPAVGLALAGGGFLGAAYELGALAALAEGIDGLDLTALGCYVGVSAGAFIAAGLANGKTPHQMVRLFIEDADASLDPAALLRPARQLWRQSLASLPGIARLAIQRTSGPVRRSAAASAWDTVERVARALPAAQPARAERPGTAADEAPHKPCTRRTPSIVCLSQPHDRATRPRYDRRDAAQTAPPHPRTHPDAGPAPVQRHRRTQRDHQRAGR